MNVSEEIEFVCVWGFDKALYQKALTWVDHSRRVVFISDKKYVNEHPFIQIYSFDSLIQKELLIRKIAWSAVLKKMAILGDLPFKKELEACHLAANLILSEMADYGVEAFQNTRANMSSYKRGLDLKGAFSHIPALIVGAGPSLEKNCHLIKEFEKKALIFAAGSALNILDVEPHFAASIDKAAPHSQFKKHPFFKTPLCYQTRMNPPNFSFMQGPKLLFPDASLDAINWLYAEESFDGGWTVGNFLTAVALHMGCSPIIFVGMDYCYAKNKKYAKLDMEGVDKTIQVGDFITQSDWVMAAKWTEEKGGPFINATEGGMLNVQAKSLREVLQECFQEWDLRKKVIETVEKLPLKNANERLAEWDASLQRIQTTHNNLESEIVYQKLLEPLWRVWQPLFEREMDPDQDIKLHRTLFFQRVVEEYVSVL
jgi:hypothetical protein